MTNKTLEIYWSKAALELVGDRLTELQAKLLRDLQYFMDGAEHDFLHVFHRPEDSDILICHGEEKESHWLLFVQTGRYEPMTPMPDDHPDPERRGKVFQYPATGDSPANSEFSAIDEPSSYH